MTLRSRVIALAKKTNSLKARVLAHGGKSKVLNKAYARARLELAKARRALAAQRRSALRLHAANEAEVALRRHIFETGGNNRGRAVEEVIHYAHGMTGEPWCVDFVIWCYGHAGSLIVRPGYPRAVALMREAFVVRTGTPKRGDIVRYTFDHTGIFLKDNGDGTITTIEGNTGASGAVSDGNGSDGVYKKIRSKGLVEDYLRVVK